MRLKAAFTGVRYRRNGNAAGRNGLKSVRLKVALELGAGEVVVPLEEMG